MFNFFLLSYMFRSLITIFVRTPSRNKRSYFYCNKSIKPANWEIRKMSSSEDDKKPKAAFSKVKDEYLQMALEEKRKLYKGGNYVGLEDIPTWEKYFKPKEGEQQGQPEDENKEATASAENKMETASEENKMETASDENKEATASDGNKEKMASNETEMETAPDENKMEVSDKNKVETATDEKEVTAPDENKMKASDENKMETATDETKQEVSEMDCKLSKLVSMWRGDITQLEIDTIVNAANSSLLGGGGVDGAIHRAAGKSLTDECRTLNGCKVGHAKITGGYKLPAKYVIHTVGPQQELPEKLKSCYTSSLQLLLDNKLRTVAFPCISTGIYGYPQAAAAEIAVSTVRKFLEKHADELDRVIFCIFLGEDERIYKNVMQKYFPVK